MGSGRLAECRRTKPILGEAFCPPSRQTSRFHSATYWPSCEASRRPSGPLFRSPRAPPDARNGRPNRIGVQKVWVKPHSLLRAYSRYSQVLRDRVIERTKPAALRNQNWRYIRVKQNRLFAAWSVLNRAVPAESVMNLGCTRKHGGDDLTEFRNWKWPGHARVDGNSQATSLRA
jgi:hypothetical protein